MKPEEMSEIQLDALCEVGSIGAGHAATALSQMTNRMVDISVPMLELVPLPEIPYLLGGPERLVAAVHTLMCGEISGAMLFMADRESSLALVDLMRARMPGTAKSFGHEEQTQLTHVASIVTAAYLAAIARLADLSVLPALPSFVLDMAGAVLASAAAESGLTFDKAMVVRTRFTAEETDIEAVLLFLPDPGSLEVLLGRLGVIE